MLCTAASYLLLRYKIVNKGVKLTIVSVFLFIFILNILFVIFFVDIKDYSIIIFLKDFLLLLSAFLVGLLVGRSVNEILNEFNDMP